MERQNGTQPYENKFFRIKLGYETQQSLLAGLWKFHVRDYGKII